MFVFHTALTPAFTAFQLPVAVPFLRLCWAASFVWALQTKWASETHTVCFNGLHHLGWFCLNQMAQALIQTAAAAAEQPWPFQSRQLTMHCQPWWPWWDMREKFTPTCLPLPSPVTFKYNSQCLLPKAEILKIGDCAARLQSSCDLLPPLYFQWVHSMWRQHWVKYCPNDSFRHLLVIATGLQPYWEPRVRAAASCLPAGRVWVCGCVHCTAHSHMSSGG